MPGPPISLTTADGIGPQGSNAITRGTLRDRVSANRGYVGNATPARQPARSACPPSAAGPGGARRMQADVNYAVSLCQRLTADLRRPRGYGGAAGIGRG